jgi:hypothetical protein
LLDFFDYQMPENQAQDLKYQINQYFSEILIVTLVREAGAKLRKEFFYKKIEKSRTEFAALWYAP